MESIAHAESEQESRRPLAMAENYFSIAGIEIRPRSREMLFGAARVQLTRRELDVLLPLVSAPDRVITREAIYEVVWGGRMPYRDRAVDVYVRRVRGKLRTLSPDVDYVHTHFGIGYRFWPQPNTADGVASPSDDRLLADR